MDRMEFIQRVRKYAQLETDEQAQKVTEAVLETLGECLYQRRDGLAAELPKGIKELLFKKHPPEEQTRHHVVRISLEEFYNRAHARSDVGRQEAVNASLAVATVLKQAVSPGAIEEAVTELPVDLRPLLS